MKSLHGTRKAAHNWEKKWQSVRLEMNLYMVASNRVLSSARCECIRSGDIIFVGECMQMLKRLIRYLVGHGRLVQVIFEQRHVKAPRVDTESDLRGMCTHSKQFNRNSSFSLCQLT